MERFQIIADSIARWSLLLGLFLLPFFFIPVPWVSLLQSKVLVALICIIVAALAWGTARFLEGTIRAPDLLVLGAGALIPLAYILSVLVAGITPASLFGSGVEQDTLAAAIMLYAAFACSALIFSSAPPATVLALRGLFTGGLILVALQIIQHVFPNSLSLGGVFATETGNALGSWHDLSILLGFFVIVGTGLLSTSVAEGRWRFLISAVIGISLLFLVLGNSFDVWVGLTIVASLFLLFRIYTEKSFTSIASIKTIASIKEFPWRLYKTWIALILFALFFSLFGSAIHSGLKTSVRIDNAEVRPSLSGTFAIGGQTLGEPSTFLFGAGPNTFTREWGRYKPAEINTTPFWNATFASGFGSVPTSLITVGIIGAISWLLFIFAVLWTARRVLITPSDSETSVTVSRMLVVGAVFLILFHIVYVPGPALSMLTFLFIGLLIGHAAHTGAISNRAWNTSDKESRPAILVLASFVTIILVTGASLGRVVAAETVLNHAVTVYNTSGDLERTTALINRSLRISESDRAHRTAVEIGLLRLQDMIRKADPNDAASQKALQDALSETITHGLSAVSIGGNSYQNWLELASLYQQLAGADIPGAYENARTAYMRALSQNPNNPFPYLQLAQLDFLEGKIDDATNDLMSAIKLKPDFALAYYVASQLYATQKDFKNALPAAALAVQYAPEDPLGWYNLGAIAYAAGDYTNGAGALQQALIRQPQYANALYVLALSFYQLGEEQYALAAFEELNKIDPNQSVVIDSIAKLRAGERLPSSVTGIVR